MTSTSRRPMLAELPWWGGGLAVLTLLVALGANVLALSAPFMTLHEAFEQPYTYSLPGAAVLMWQQRLYVISLLIVGFSICFPFIKIGGLLGSLLLPLSARGRGRLLAVLGAMGRWSLLDVFVVMLLMVIASHQWAVSTQVHVGVFLFMAAIGLAMLVTECLEAAHRRRHQEGPPPEAPIVRPVAIAGWHGVVAMTLLLLALVGLVVAATTPMLEIEQFLLRHTQYSVVGAIETLFESGAWVFAGLLAVLLLVVPLARLLPAALWWCLRTSPRRRHDFVRWSDRAGRWSGLEVFALALLLVVTEGSELIRTEAKGGAYLLIGAILANTLAFLSIHRVRRIRLPAETAAAASPSGA